MIIILADRTTELPNIGPADRETFICRPARKAAITFPPFATKTPSFKRRKIWH
jgi:hypothetical protein